jgi:hypothetical protein
MNVVYNIKSGPQLDISNAFFGVRVPHVKNFFTKVLVLESNKKETT